MKAKTMQAEHQVHPIPPFYDKNSRILVLGSFPSVKSRETGFFYGHPQNRYWKMMAEIFGDGKNTAVPETIPQKKEFLRRHHIAMWDTIAACTITGSSDSSLRDVVPNDISGILRTADIRRIFCNGAASWNLREAEKMPSTSPANAAWSLERLVEAWKICRTYAEKD